MGTFREWILGGSLAVLAMAWAVGAEANSLPESTLNSQTWFWCMKGDGRLCTRSEFADPERYRQVLILPTGFKAKEMNLFRAEFNQTVMNISGSMGGAVYSGAYASQLLYVGYWLPGGALGEADAALGGAIQSNPKRGKSLTLKQEQVHAIVDYLAAQELPGLKPWSVIALFNSNESGVTANASPPSFIRKPYGISKISRFDLLNPYVAMHELAHSALNFVDEYVEPGLEKLDIRLLDLLAAGALFDGTGRGFAATQDVLGGVYDFRLSEILGANGNDNVDVTRHPSRVQSEDYTPNEYEYEGGMFFGLGTFHDSGKNIMGGVAPPGGGDQDGFGWGHSRSQFGVIRQVFEDQDRAPRPNDRIRAAGPNGRWSYTAGAAPKLLIFDGDKNHHYHPTLKYEVQLGWYKKQWKTCWWGFVPYPCADDVWTTAEKSVKPELKTLNLSASKLYGLVESVRGLLCHLGLRQVGAPGQPDGAFKLCELTVNQMAQGFLPSIEFSIPYQEVEATALDRGRQYWWRFRTDNGTYRSGWTGWAALPIRY